MRSRIQLTLVVSLGTALVACSGDPVESVASPDSIEDDRDRDGDEPVENDPFPAGSSGCVLTESVGQTRIQVQAAAGASYCDGCALHTRLNIRLPDGEVVEASSGSQCGRTACESCGPGACLEIPCSDFDTGNLALNWNGAVNSANRCGENVSCNEICYLPEGEYELIYCTTRGTLAETANSQQVCEKEMGDDGQRIEDCVTVPFSFPSEPGETVQVVELGPTEE